MIRRLSEGADFSYGIYLYAYPVQQTLVALYGPHDPLANAVIFLVLTLPLAAASWYLVERPALALKPRLSAWAEAVSHRADTLALRLRPRGSR